MGGYSGGTRGRVPLNNWSGGVNEIVSPKICGIHKHVEQVVLCLPFLLRGNLQPSPNPLARFMWTAWRGGEGNVERGGGKRKERKGK